MTTTSRAIDIEVNVRERVLKPARDVFTAIVDPAHMSRYFISGASGPLTAGSTVVWEFADVGAKVPVDVVEMEDDRKVVIEGGSPRTRTTIDLSAEADATVVTIREREFPMDEEGVKRAMVDSLPLLAEGLPPVRDQRPRRPEAASRRGLNRAATNE